MLNKVKTASIINIIANVFLFLIKFTIGLISGSISIISDAINSLSDIIAAIFIFVTVKINNEGNDNCHQFGHSRAENIAGYTTGILMILLAFTIAKVSVEKFISKEVIEYSVYMLLAVIITLLVKSSLFIYIKNIVKNYNSPALKANMQDHINDVYIILGVFIAILGIKYGVWWLDSVVGFVIAIYILISGIKISWENIGFLMGVSADEQMVKKIKKKALEIENVLGVNDIFTQYLGTKIQVEIHIEVDKNSSLKKAHDIGKKVKWEIESIEEINNCFVHIDEHKK